MFQCNAPEALTGRWENDAVPPGDFPVVERAEHEASAVRTEVAGEIMCGHNEKIALQFTPRHCGVKGIGNQIVFDLSRSADGPQSAAAGRAENAASRDNSRSGFNLGIQITTPSGIEKWISRQPQW